MDWVIGILLVIIGSLIGFFIGRAWQAKQLTSTQVANELEDTHQQFNAYRRDVIEYLAQARQLSNEVVKNQTRLERYLKESENLLQSSKEWQDSIGHLDALAMIPESDSDPSLPFHPPRDYSEPGSGLFSSSQKS